MDVFWTLPPVTRTITASAVVVSALGYAGIISLSKFVFIAPWVFTYRMTPQIWRAVTGFLITHKGMAIAMDPYFCTFEPCAPGPSSPLTLHSIPVR